MKKILIVLLFSIFIFLIFYKISKKERFENQIIFRNNVGNAKCLQDDIDMTNSYFMCQLNSKYSPININVNIIKYHKILKLKIKKRIINIIVVKLSQL